MALLKYETLTAAEVQLIVDGKSLDKPTVGDLLDREHNRLAETEAKDEPAAEYESAEQSPETDAETSAE